MASETDAATVDPAEVVERLEAMRVRFDEFRGRL